MEIFQIIKGSIGKALEIVVIQGPEILDTLHNILRVGMGGDVGYTVYDRSQRCTHSTYLKKKRILVNGRKEGEGKVSGFWCMGEKEERVKC